MGKFSDFTAGKHAIPKKTTAWRIYGKGMENFGDQAGSGGKGAGERKAPVELPVPEPKDDEILVRNDAIGLCFSDTKIIKFGSEHPRIQGRDLRKEPVIPGHEVAVTVIKAGKLRAKDYKPGDRYIVQADAFYKGKSTSYGYMLPGGLAQYGVITKELLDGDAGSYLIPIKNPKVGYSEVALVEPWACVVAAYRIEHRKGIKEGGALLVIGGAGHEGKEWKLDGLFKGGAPKTIALAGVGAVTKAKIAKAAASKGAEIQDGGEHAGGPAIRALAEKHTQKKGFDDIVILGDAADDTVVAAGDCMCKDGILNYMVGTAGPQVVDVDVGKVHYDRIAFIGSTGIDAAAPYSVNMDSSLRGNSVIMFGAGGPMGQMHVQLVLEDKNPPKVLIATDIAKDRLDVLREKFSSRAKERGIDYRVMNPNDFQDAAAFRKEVLKANKGRLFDYVVCLAAIPAVVADSASYLADGATLNIFAGVSRGTIVKLNVKETAARSVRYIGSSGSSLDDMVYTLRKVESGELDTDGAVAGVSGMNDVWNGIDAVRNASFPGKIVVYPHVGHADLTSLKDLKGAFPGVASRLSKNGNWNREAEKAFLDEKLEI